MGGEKLDLSSSEFKEAAIKLTQDTDGNGKTDQFGAGGLARAWVGFIWREGGSGSRTALLSREAAKALGLGQGDVANVAVYLPR